MGQDVLQLAREWLLTNGAGGSAHGTASGVPARRAHAWLHAFDDHSEVVTVLLGFDERLTAAGLAWELSPLPARDAEPEIPPAVLESFTPDPWPTWRYRCGEVVIERWLFLVRDHQAVAISYRHVAGPDARLRLGPRVVARPPLSLQRETPDMRGVAHGIPGRVRIETVPGRPTLTLWHNGTFLPSRLWHRGIEYAWEPHRKSAEREDAFVPGLIEAPLTGARSPQVVVSTEEGLFRSLAIEGQLGAPPPSTLSDCVAALAQGERARHRAFMAAALLGADDTARQATTAHGDAGAARRDPPLLDPRDRWTAHLTRALALGLARRRGRATVLSGFPAAEERGVDALRAVPGLIATRSFDTAREVLRGFLEYLDDGLAPESFDADAAPRYGDAAPALWLIHAAELLTRRSEDAEWARLASQGLESIVQHLRAGSRHGVSVDRDGLLKVGESGEKPAALNALWYHALVAMSQLARLAGRKEGAAFYLAWARQHGQCFQETLWDEAHDCLFEATTDGTPRPGFSPSQLLALALPPALLPAERAARLLDRIERELYTPLGLRPGPDAHRVETEWLGPFYAAMFRVRGRGPEIQAFVRRGFDALRARLEAATPGYVPDAFEPAGEPGRRGRKPSTPPPLETWRPAGVSTLAAAGLLTVWIEDVEHAADPAPVA